MRCIADYERVRSVSVGQVATLEPEDCVVQCMPDVSPPKWHLAHTSWFFETFVLQAHVPGYLAPWPAYRSIFNSYYEAVGPKHPRTERGHLSRPTLAEVMAYRRHVDEAMLRAIPSLPPDALALVELGLHHEQQHQELLVMDVKYNFGQSPIPIAYRPGIPERCSEPAPLRFLEHAGGLVEIGHDASASSAFAFDNEGPRHQRFVQPFALANRLVTNGEYLAFMLEGGYARPGSWLSDGLSWVREHGVEAPLYWRDPRDGERREHTAHGELSWDPNAPVSHVSGYEAAAFADWSGARLPTEFEWELAASTVTPGPFAALEDGRLHPAAPAAGSGAESELSQMFGELWQWTRSAYEPYPGFRAARGAVGEYNGKFMSGQWVLRGGCVATPRGHVRATYRNFFYPHQRWPFTGIRLARDVS